MPKYTKKQDNKEIASELVITREEAAKMLGVDPEKHWFRVIHEIADNAAPWALVRLQAIPRVK